MIHLMRPNDIPNVMWMLLDLAHETPAYVGLAAHYQFVRGNLERAISHESFIGVVSSTDVGQLTGVMFGNVGSMWYSPELIAFEQVLYVMPEYRKGTNGMKLIRSFERIAEGLGAAEIRAGSTTGINDEGVLKLYERLGYKRYGTGVRKRIA